MPKISEQESGNIPLVSVAIPTHNRREILNLCLDALSTQTHPAFEIIVVDDGSTDGTSDFLKHFTTEHPELSLRTLHNPAPLGANASRNRAISEARGDFVAFLDSDCIADPDWLDKLMAGFRHDRVATVTGTVTSPPPENIYELTFKGTNRVHDADDASRLVAGNMCIRRSLLIQYPLDEDLHYGCDEEGIYLRLRAAGFDQKVAPDARVLHEHHYQARSFFRQAYVGGVAAAWLVYKYHLRHRLDLLPFILAYLTFPLVLFTGSLGIIPAIFFLAALTAITYNDLFRKKKSIAETIYTFPILILYYHVRLMGYLVKTWYLHFTRHQLKRIRLDRQTQ